MAATSSSFRSFASQYSHFFFGAIMTQILGFVTFPLLTRLLTKEQYGILGLVTTTLLYAVVLAKLGLSDGIIRLFKEYDGSEERRGIFASTVFFRSVFLAAAAAALYLLALPAAFNLFKADRRYYACFAVMAIYLFFKPLNMAVVNLMRVSGKTLLLNVVSFVNRVVALLASLGLLLLLSRSLLGYFAGVVLAEVIAAALFLSWFLRNFRLAARDVSPGLAKSLILFGAPLVLTELSYNVLSFGDRYLVAAMSGSAALGIYTVGYNMALYVANTIIFSLSYAIVPVYVNLYHQEGPERTKEFLARCLNMYLIAIIPVCAGFTAVAKGLFLTLASSKYLEAASFAPLILVANLLLGMNSILNAGLFLNKKSTTIMAIMLAASAVNIVANLLLIPPLGLMGAALSTVLACLVALGLTVALSFRLLPISLDLRHVPTSVLLAAIMLLALHWVRLGNETYELVAKVLVGLVIVAAGYLTLMPEVFGNLRARVFGR